MTDASGAQGHDEHAGGDTGETCSDDEADFRRGKLARRQMKTEQHAHETDRRGAQQGREVEEPSVEHAPL